MSVQAESGAQIDREAKAALAKLYQEVPGARELGKAAKAILIFPNIVKGGLIVGGQYGASTWAATNPRITPSATSPSPIEELADIARPLVFPAAGCLPVYDKREKVYASVGRSVRWAVRPACGG